VAPRPSFPESSPDRQQRLAKVRFSPTGPIQPLVGSPRAGFFCSRRIRPPSSIKRPEKKITATNGNKNCKGLETSANALSNFTVLIQTPRSAECFWSIFQIHESFDLPPSLKFASKELWDQEIRKIAILKNVPKLKIEDNLSGSQNHFKNPGGRIKFLIRKSMIHFQFMPLIAVLLIRPFKKMEPEDSPFIKHLLGSFRKSRIMFIGSSQYVYFIPVHSIQRILVSAFLFIC